MNHADRSPLIVAHRGLSWDYPENTMAAFEAALKHQPAYIELDFRTTADGRLVCIHDATLDRYLTGKQMHHAGVSVESCAFDRLRGIDLGAWKHERFTDTRVATLEEVIASANGHAGSASPPVLMIEHKTGTVDQLIEHLDMFNSPRQYVVQSFDHAFLEELRRRRSEAGLAMLGSGPLSGDLISQARSLGCVAMHWDIHVTRADVAAMHEAGLEAWVYTLNHPLMWLGAAALGVDAITTDRCDEAAAFYRDPG